MQMFDPALVEETRRKNGLKQNELAEMLGVSKSYLCKIEKGAKKPSVEFISRLVSIPGMSAEYLPTATAYDAAAANVAQTKNFTQTKNLVQTKNLLRREHRDHKKTQDEKWELEERVRHLEAKIQFRDSFIDIMFDKDKSLSKQARLKKLEELAVSAMAIGELNFEEIMEIYKKVVTRSVLWSWLHANKKPYYECFLEKEVMAASPKEAALILRCSNCAHSELGGKCAGHGSEDPRDIFELLDDLHKIGMYGAAEQAEFIEKYYDMRLSAEYITDMRYKERHGHPIPDEVRYMYAGEVRE